MSQLAATLSQYWSKIQETLFPQLEEQLDPLTEKQQQLVTTKDGFSGLKQVLANKTPKKCTSSKTYGKH